MTDVAAHPLERDFDIFDIRAELAGGDFQQAFKRQIDGFPEIFWTPRNGGHWCLTRAEDIELALSDHERFSARYVMVPKEASADPPLPPVMFDPPDHARYRALLARALSPPMVAKLERRARSLAISLIEGFQFRGACEFVSEFAHHLPIEVFMSMVDLPLEDRPELLEIAAQVERPSNREVRAAGLARLAGYAMRKIDERRAVPGDDVISDLIRARIDGEPLSDDALRGMVMLLMIGGLDTVASMLSFFARFLALNPDHRHWLADNPGRVPDAVEELLRRFAIIIAARVVARDFEHKGVQFRVGEMVVAPTMLHALDETKFPGAGHVDLERPRPMHMSFGAGVHRCVGSMLARAELRIFLEEWLRRIPDFEIAPEADVVIAARSIATIEHLRLVWPVAAQGGV